MRFGSDDEPVALQLNETNGSIGKTSKGSVAERAAMFNKTEISQIVPANSVAARAAMFNSTSSPQAQSAGGHARSKTGVGSHNFGVQRNQSDEDEDDVIMSNRSSSATSSPSWKKPGTTSFVPPTSPGQGQHSRSKTGAVSPLSDGEGLPPPPAMAPPAFKKFPPSPSIGGGNVVDKGSESGGQAPHRRMQTSSFLDRIQTFDTVAMTDEEPPEAGETDASPHRRQKTSSVLDRVKAFSSESGTSPTASSTPPHVKRPSLLALAEQGGAVSDLRALLSEAGFNPSEAPEEVQDMIDRGRKGRIHQTSAESDDDEELSDEDEPDDSDGMGTGSDSEGGSQAMGGRNSRGRSSVTEGSDDDDLVKQPAANGVVKVGGRVSIEPPPAVRKSVDGKRKSVGTKKENGTGSPKKAPPIIYPESCNAPAIKVQSLARMLLARSAVRRKLVSEVTAFSLIMDKGIGMVKHPFGSRAKAKKVTVTIVQRKGEMQLAWGGRSAMPLSAIYGVVKGVQTTALKRSLDRSPDVSTEACFSLLTQQRTLDFEVANPWLTHLIVRAMRLFLGAHYNTIPAPRFFSPLALRRKKGNDGASHKQQPIKHSMVWTADEAGSRALPQAQPPSATQLSDTHTPALSPYSEGYTQTTSPGLRTPNHGSSKSRAFDFNSNSGHSQEREKLSPGTSSAVQLSPGTGAVHGSGHLKHSPGTSPNNAGGGSPSSQSSDWGLSFTINAVYKTHDDDDDAEEVFVAADLNDKLQSLRKLVGQSDSSNPSDDSLAQRARRSSRFFSEVLGARSTSPASPSSSKQPSPERGPSSRSLSPQQHGTHSGTHTPSNGSGEQIVGQVIVVDEERERKKHELLMARSASHQRGGAPRALHPPIRS